MSKKNKLPIKIESPYTCPNCGEKNYFYISKKGKKKGILVGEYFHENGIKENIKSSSLADLN